MSYPPIFTTKRLVVRRLAAEDAASMVAIFGDAETMRFVGDTKTLSEADCRYWIVDVTDKNFETRGYGLVGVIDKDSAELIGCAGVFHPGQQAEPEVMYWLRRDQWGKGYATEIVRGIVLHSKQSLGIGWMMATIHPDNVPSQHVIAKAGFVHTRDQANEDGSVTQVWELPATT